MGEKHYAVKVNKDRLYDEIRAKGLTITGASKEMGFGKSTLGMAATQGYITYTQALLLEKMWNIKREDYEIVEEKPEEENPKETTLDMDKLYRTIYSAVFNAMKQVWGES